MIDMSDPLRTGTRVWWLKNPMIEGVVRAPFDPYRSVIVCEDKKVVKEVAKKHGFPHTIDKIVIPNKELIPFEKKG